ncbi:NnrS family protein [Azospirillum halopraeferens]|uniref:NnrS family protein n=1 Tax=Azospirillum halopraeferens TaxID=34010 RepID=UPI000426F9E2|nr:NnrS family protein [Azospirillum halopraeferens]
MSLSPAAPLGRIRPSLLVAYGFRPFFLFAGLAAFLVMAGWLVVLATGSWPAGPVAPTAWHAHAMLYGFVTAAIAGFLLTAVPNWTGTAALSGAPLGGLVALYLAGRMALLPGLGVPPAVAAVADLLFLPALAVALAGPLVRAGALRNTAFLGLLALLWIGNALFHLEWLGLAEDGVRLGRTLAIGTVVMMIAVVGGRIVPAFTRNALAQRGVAVDVSPRPWVERIALAATLLLIPAEMAAPGSTLAGAVALVAALAHGVRMGRWHGWRTGGQPLVWVLHAGYAWLPVGLALKAMHGLGLPVSESAGIHALTAGAFAVMILAVMTRASLGHSGRPLVVGAVIAWSYRLLLAGAVLRVLADVAPGSLYRPLLDGAGAAWLAAFALYLMVYAPILLSPRADGRSG